VTRAAFQAEFADFKIVRTRKTAQLVFELPLEAADAALAALGGLPRPDVSAWVGICRIDPTKAASEPPEPADEPTKERRKWNRLAPSQQAALRCKEGGFQRFILEEHIMGLGDEESAIEFVRRFCGVASRSEIKLGTPAAGKWLLLDNEYQAWLHT
jgi:hypothetical protein